MARLLWDIVTTGQAILPNGKELIPGPGGWFDVVKFIYGQVDGPPKQRQEITGEDGGPVTIRVIYDAK